MDYECHEKIGKVSSNKMDDELKMIVVEESAEWGVGEVFESSSLYQLAVV